MVPTTDRSLLYEWAGECSCQTAQKGQEGERGLAVTGERVPTPAPTPVAANETPFETHGDILQISTPTPPTPHPLPQVFDGREQKVCSVQFLLEQNWGLQQELMSNARLHSI